MTTQRMPEILAGRSPVSSPFTTRDVRSKFRDIDRRLADVETYYTSRNSSLANEIDSLR